MTAVLAIDPAQNCGYALRHGQAIVSGVWRLKQKPKEDKVLQFVRFREQLGIMHALVKGGLTAVVYERLNFHNSVASAHVHAGLKATLLLFAHDNGIPVYDYTPGQWKKAVTGKGSGGKEGSLALTRLMGYEPETSDEADALCILWTYEKEHGGPGE